MKKFLGTLIAALMMATGLSVLAASSAQAACPYTNCIDTSTRVSAPAKVKRGTRAKVCVEVTTAGNGTPKGKVHLRVNRSNGGYVFRDVKNYKGGEKCFRTSTLKKKGKYTVHANFERKPGSAWKDSDNRTSFRVTRRG